MSISKQESPQPHMPIASPADANDYIILLKPRVMSLVVFTALVGMMVAPEPINPVLGFVAILCIAVGGGASGALNMWYDADIDAIMKRTRKRPIPAGKVTGGEVLVFGLVLSALSVFTMGIFINWFSAAFLAFTIFFYVVIYTMWLKRSTPQNIVIGGAAGAFPPMIGWAAATGTISIESVILFLIIFMWTPPHFWALSLFVTTDYGEAHIPMMPNVKGERSTKNQILVYAILMALCGIAPYFIGFAGITYGILSTILGVVFIYYSYELWKTKQREQTVVKAKKLFFFSLIYLAALFAILLVESLATRLISYLGA
ncbi:protoheme IX farnesyltransferase [Bartonella sp. M0283]|uniref:heme o synthase n=1 Tax=Bartonella sp. M0283 TaxID=2751016 RepID=UPI0018DCBB6A|nr:heme o synthase [Bartonella sp. M0283]MBI0163185.1 protoheme IX farnesyltransferase [Bartonella sp. M0283]